MNTLLISGCPDVGHPSFCWNETSLSQDKPPALFLPSPVPSLPATLHAPAAPTARRPLRVLLIGDRQDVITTIQNLHKRGFADAGEWSIPLPYPQQNAVAQFIPRGLSHVVISVHTKYLS